MKKHIFKTLSLLSVTSFSGLYLINKFLSAKGNIKSFKAERNGLFFEDSFGKLYYKKEGEGSPVLLIHDTESNLSGYEWQQLSKMLSSDYCVYTIDLLGTGLSDKPPITYTNYLFVRIITNFIENVIQDAPYVIASGFSSSFALVAASVKPDLIKELLLINPPSLKQLKKTPSQRSKARWKLLTFPILGSTLYNIIHNRKNLEYKLEEKCVYNPFLLNPKFYAIAWRNSHNSNGNGRYFYASMQGNYLNWDIQNALQKLTIPTSILYTSKNRNGREVASSYQHLYNPISVHTLKCCGLLPQIEKPSELFTLLKEELNF